MKKNDGKVTISGIILLLLIAYGVFASIKLISTNIMQSQIENEIVDTLGVVRGPDLTEEKARDEIITILQKNGVEFDPEDADVVNVKIDRNSGKLMYFFKYEVEVDLIFFKQRRKVEVKNEIRSYS